MNTESQTGKFLSGHHHWARTNRDQRKNSLHIKGGREIYMRRAHSEANLPHKFWVYACWILKQVIYLFVMEEMNPTESKWQWATLIRLSPQFLGCSAALTAHCTVQSWHHQMDLEWLDPCPFILRNVWPLLTKYHSVGFWSIALMSNKHGNFFKAVTINYIYALADKGKTSCFKLDTIWWWCISIDRLQTFNFAMPVKIIINVFH